MLTFHTLDVFTTRPYAGNPLAVVLGADELSPSQMQTIAREFNLSETIFVQAPRDPANTAKVRIFFPSAEIPFAGHPTVGCAVLLAVLAEGEGDFTRHIRLEEEAGLVPVTVTRKGRETRAEFTAPVLPEALSGTVAPEMAARALGLAPEDIGLPGHAIGTWQGGPKFLYLPIRDRATLARARPCEPHWSEMMQAAGVDSGYLYTNGHGVDFQARMFSPTHGIPEDPATGSASAILSGPLHAAGLVPPGTTHFRLMQGVEMGRPSEITLSVDADADGPTAIRIGGAAVRMSEGLIRVSERAFAMP
ncbi:PhzF family phenazine biosynthesis protein [Solirhodobacter olei]|uniref:PhzF family phenazine biosynthesis protein n=1 Tax=Solirhodobacter olei TaxID=2493082 RepID=UPI000FD78DF7|nr:PhzF family phenazine biosynthesis protein [Solirhodobacter olei]